ncbi:T9SS type A sorting domain-containing protein [Candidatus Fermentibacteria bacterium]|nr:T9SS type A sorting domain-containing protein [Candidatus Fermentibacteria bacterium]
MTCPKRAIVMFAVVVGAGTLPGTADEDWVTEGVDCPHFVVNIKERGLCVDTEGNPHMVYGGRDGFYYARRDPTGWHVEQIAGLCGEYISVSLVLTAGDEPHIAFSGDREDGPGSYLGYAARDAAGWHLAMVDSAGDTGGFPCLAMDGLGRPHIAYHANEWAPGSLRYAVCDEGSWLIETIEVPETPGVGLSLAVDSYDYPHLSYVDGVNGALMYVYFDGIIWDRQVVDGQGRAGMHNSIVLDAQDHPHIAYYDERTHDLKYARLDGITWFTEVVDSIGSVGQYCSLALDEAAVPNISYQDATTPSLKHAAKSGQLWILETAVTGIYPVGSSLAFGPDGAVCIGFTDVSQELVGLVCKEGAGWELQEVERAGVVGDCQTLVLDAAGTPHLLYYEALRGQVRHAWQVREGWLIEVVDDGSVGESISAGMSPSGVLHAGYWDGANADLTHAWHDASGWHTETVDAAGQVGRYASVAVDEAGWPQIAYFDDSNTALKHARLSSSGWIIEQAATAGGRTPCIALDADELPHISHYDGAAKDLKYSYADASGWHTESIDKPGDVGNCSSILIDGARRPHISYTETISGTCPGLAMLRYAHFDGSAWLIETVAEAKWWNATSIALDDAGRVCIAFGAFGSGLSLATKGSSGWDVQESCPSPGGIGPSLAFNDDGRPCIVHGDNAAKDLLYTYSIGVGTEDHGAGPHTGALLSISPNPARDRVSIVYDNGEAGPVTLGVYDLSGRLLRGERRGFRSTRWEIPDGLLPNGTYLIRLETPSRETQRRLVVVR